MDEESASELGLEPSGLGRHDHASVRNVDELLHLHGVHGECHLHLAVINTALQLLHAADTANKVNTLVSAQVTNVQDGLENKATEDSDIQGQDRVELS